MGIYVEEIGGWVDRYIFKPICSLIGLVLAIIAALAILCIPIAAIKYLFF